MLCYVCRVPRTTYGLCIYIENRRHQRRPDIHFINLFGVRTVAYKWFFAFCHALRLSISLQTHTHTHTRCTHGNDFEADIYFSETAPLRDMWHFYFASRKLIYHCFFDFFFFFFVSFRSSVVCRTATCDGAAANITFNNNNQFSRRCRSPSKWRRQKKKQNKNLHTRLTLNAQKGTCRWCIPFSRFFLLLFCSIAIYTFHEQNENYQYNSNNNRIGNYAMSGGEYSMRSTTSTEPTGENGACSVDSRYCIDYFIVESSATLTADWCGFSSSICH